MKSLWKYGVQSRAEEAQKNSVEVKKRNKRARITSFNYYKFSLLDDSEFF